VILQIEDKKFVVKGSTQTYDVDMDLELCSCPAGQTGAPGSSDETLQLFVTLLSTNKSRDESRADETDIGR